MLTPDAKVSISYGVAQVRDREDTGEITLESIYDLYASALFRYALTLVGCSDDAEDAVQEVFVRIAHEIDRLRRVEHIKAYLFAATRNAAFNLLRGRRRRNVLQDSICAEFSTICGGGIVESIADSVTLCRVFSELPIEQREVLALKVFEEMTFKEIAATVRASQNTVASRYRYAIEKLRQSLEENDDE